MNCKKSYIYNRNEKAKNSGTLNEENRLENLTLTGVLNIRVTRKDSEQTT